MSRRLRRGKEAQRGQILPLLVIMVLFLLFLAAFPLDGGLAQVLRQETQNAADAAAEGAAAALADTCFNPGSTTTSGGDLIHIINTIIKKNTPGTSADNPTKLVQGLYV